MSRLKLNITELILQAMAFFVLFIPGMYNKEIWTRLSYGKWKLSFESVASFWDAANHHKWFFYIIAGLMLFNVVLLLLEIFKVDQKFNLLISAASPVLTAVFLFIFNSVFEKMADDLYSTIYTANWLFYVELFLLTSVLLTALLKCSNRTTENQTTEVQS